MVIIDLLQNFALLIAISATYRVILARQEKDSLSFQVLVGLLFAVAGILGMLTPMNFLPGVFFDGRSIILSIAGLFGGPISAIIAASACVAYRWWVGGAGVVMGISVIVESAAIGVLFYYLRQRTKLSLSIPVLFGFSFIVHLIMFFLTLALPGGAGFVVMRQIGYAILFLYPLVSTVICLFFLDSETQIRDRKALVESEKALNKAQEVAHVGSWTWYVQEDRYVWSDEMYRIFGIDKDRFNGHLSEVIHNYVHPDDRAAVGESYRSVIEKNLPIPVEYRVLRSDGSERVVWAESGELTLGKKGEAEILTGIVQDITERREAERKLKESESRYRNLILHSPDAIFVNHNDQVVLVNLACMKLFGAKSADELIGKSPYDLFHPDFHKQIRDRIYHLRDLGEVAPVVEEKIVRLDGQVVDVDALAAPFTFKGGNDIHVILRDITERKQMQDALQSSHDLLARLAEQVPGVVYQYQLDPDGSSRFPYASPGMYDIYEVTPEEVCEDATVVFGRLHPEDYDTVANAIFESARTLELFHVVFRVNLPQQGLRWRSSYAKPERIANGGTLWYGIITDITDRKLAEQKIEEQLQELRRWQAVMVGREKRVIELKHEVNELLLQADQPPRYAAEANNTGKTRSRDADSSAVNENQQGDAA